MTSPILLVVTTLGRVEPLRRLFGSVIPQLGPDDRLIVVAQDNVDDVRALVDAAGHADQITLLTSARGASVGRNTGLHARPELSDSVLVMFPNDTTWFPDGSIDAVRQLLGDAPGGAVTVRTADKDRLRLPPPGTPLDRSTIWQVMEVSLVLWLGLLRRIGGFDATIGTGAATPWQAGEVTDLLLRALLAEPSLARGFVWTRPEEVWVGAVPETAGLDSRARRWKLRCYGRGVGRVFGRYPFPLWHRWGFVAAGLLVGIRRGDEYRLSDGLSAFIGRLEGVLGRTLGSGNAPAVSR